MMEKQQNKKILEIVFDLAIETNKLEREQETPIISLLSEPSHSFGLKIYKEPLNKLVEGFDDIFKKHIDLEEYPDAGGDLYYCLFERALIYGDKPEKEEEQAIIIKKGSEEKAYSIQNKENALLYLFEEIICSYIKEEVKVNQATEEEEFIKLSIDLMVLLLDYHKETNRLSNIFAKVLLTYCNSDFCNGGQLWENFPAMKNIEINIEEKLIKLVSNKMYEDIFYIWRDEENYGEKKDFTLPRNISENEEVVKITNQLEFAQWFLSQKK